MNLNLLLLLIFFLTRCYRGIVKVGGKTIRKVGKWLRVRIGRGWKYAKRVGRTVRLRYKGVRTRLRIGSRKLKMLLNRRWRAVGYGIRRGKRKRRRRRLRRKRRRYRRRVRRRRRRQRRRRRLRRRRRRRRRRCVLRFKFQRKWRRVYKKGKKFVFRYGRQYKKLR